MAVVPLPLQYIWWFVSFNCRPVVAVVFERYFNHLTCLGQDPQRLWCSSWTGSSPGAENSSGRQHCGLAQAPAWQLPAEAFLVSGMLGRLGVPCPALHVPAWHHPS